MRIFLCHPKSPSCMHCKDHKEIISTSVSISDKRRPYFKNLINWSSDLINGNSVRTYEDCREGTT